jgi:hypothetical protein
MQLSDQHHFASALEKTNSEKLTAVCSCDDYNSLDAPTQARRKTVITQSYNTTTYLAFFRTN